MPWHVAMSRSMVTEDRSLNLWIRSSCYQTWYLYDVTQDTIRLFVTFWTYSLAVSAYNQGHSFVFCRSICSSRWNKVPRQQRPRFLTFWTFLHVLSKVTLLQRNTKQCNFRLTESGEQILLFVQRTTFKIFTVSSLILHFFYSLQSSAFGVSSCFSSPTS